MIVRRDNRDISADILRLATHEVIKTRIVYGANLNFKIVEGYLSRLTGLDWEDYKMKAWGIDRRGEESD